MTMDTYELTPETYIPDMERGRRKKSIRSATVDRFIESDMEIASIEMAMVSEAKIAAASMSKYVSVKNLPVKIQRRKRKIYLSKIH